MSKKRRTKKEKMVASTRHDFSQVLTLPSVEQLTKKINIQEQAPHVTTAILTRDYSYVPAEIRKTLFISAVIVVLDLIFFYLLKSRIISFNGISF